jgi:hypothetical protein
MFHGDFERYGREVFEAHEESMRQYCKPGRLLEYNVGEGWEPLCKFLEVPVPDEPFPNGNDQGDFHVACRALDRSRLQVVVMKTTVICLGLAAGVIAAKRWRLIPSLRG